MKLYIHAKNQLIPLIHSRDTVHLKILQFHWLRAFITEQIQ